MLSLSKNGSLVLSAAHNDSDRGIESDRSETSNGLSLRLRSWATVWNADNTAPLLQVPLEAAVAIPTNSDLLSSGPFDLIQRAVSTDGTLSLNVQGDLSQGTRRLLLQATVSATGSSTPVGVGGVTLLDADVVWSSSPSSAAATGTKSARARAESVSGAGSGGAREAKQWWPPPPYMRDPGSSFGYDLVEVAVDHILRPCISTGASALATWPPQAFGVGILAMAVMGVTKRRRLNNRLCRSGNGAVSSGSDGGGILPDDVLHAFFDGGIGGSPSSSSSSGHKESDLGDQLSTAAATATGGGNENRSSFLGASGWSALSTPAWFLYRIMVEALKFALLLVGYAVRLLVVLALLAAVAVAVSKLMATVATSTTSQGGSKGTAGLHDRTFYLNGWQSWSFTGSFVGSDAAMPPYRLGGTLNAGFHSGGHPPPAISTASSTGGAAAASYNAFPSATETNSKASRSGGSVSMKRSSSKSSSSNSGGKSTNGGGDGWGVLGELFNRGNAAQSATAYSPEGYKVSHWFGVLAAPIDVTFTSNRSAAAAGAPASGGGGACGTAGAESSGRDGEKSPLAAAAAQLAQYTRQQHQRQQRADGVPASTAALQTYEGVVAGFVSQRRTLGTIATDDASHARLLAHADTDGVVLVKAPLDNTEAKSQHRQHLVTDWLSIELHSHFPSSSEPMASFLDFAAEAHQLTFDNLQPTLLSSPIASRASAGGNTDATSSATALVAQARDSKVPLAVAPTKAIAPLSGWCSWYHFYEHVSEDAVRTNLLAIAPPVHTRNDEEKKQTSAAAAPAAAAAASASAGTVIGTASDSSGSNYEGETSVFSSSSEAAAGAAAEEELLRLAMPLALVQVDDGYQTAWGDWSSLKPSFDPQQSIFAMLAQAGGQLLPTGGGVTAALNLLSSHGKQQEEDRQGRVRGAEGQGGNGKGFRDMRSLAADIQKAGFLPGVWLAPGAVDKHSQLAFEHPDWILRTSDGAPANAGFCGKFYYALDVTHPGAREHIASTIRTAVHTWGFKYLKLDFLHSPGVEAQRYDASYTRAEALALFLSTVKDAAGPGVYILGCGLPMGPGIGLVSAARVSADAGPQWLPTANDKHNIPGARNMLRNTVTRLAFHRRLWLNDPDCLLLRPSTSLNLHEVRTIASIVGLLGGPTIISDDVPNLTAERRSIGASLLPIASRGPRAEALDLLNREEPQIVARRFDPFQSRLDLHSGGNGVGGDDEIDTATAAASTSGIGPWDSVALINWHWRPKPLRVHVPVQAAWPPQGGPLLLPQRDGEWANHRPPFEGAAPYHCFEFWSGAYTRRWAAPVEQSKIGMTSSAFSSDGQAHPPEERYLLELGTRAYPSRTKVKDNLDRRSSSYVGDSNPGSNSGHRESVDVYQGMKVSSHGSLLYAVRPVAYATSDAESPPSSSAAVNDKRRTGTATAVRALPSFVGSDIHFSVGLEVASWVHTFDNESQKQRLEVTVSVARTVLAGQLWLYLPPWEEPKTDEKGNATHTSSHACRAPPLFSGPAFTGSAFAVQTSTGSAGSPHSDGGDKASANCASGSSTAPQQLHSPLDVWRVGVSVGDSGGVLVVEW